MTRRTVFELRKARERAHILEGLAIALANIDEMIVLIKQSKDQAEARKHLLARPWQPASMVGLLSQMAEETTYGLTEDGYHLSPEQAQSILDMRLHRLTGLEQDKILAEYKELQLLITNLNEILTSTERLMAVIREELVAVRDQFGDARRTEIVESIGDFCLEDLLPQEDVVVTLSHQGM